MNRHRLPGEIESFKTRSSQISRMNPFSEVQDYDELCEAWSCIPPYESYLEIGVSWGGSLGVIGNYAKWWTGVDLPKLVKGKELRNSLTYLTLGGIMARIPKGELLLMDSTTEETRQKVEQHAPYDLVFIDGGHSYDIVKSDLEMYIPMASWVMVHDLCLEDVAQAYDKVSLPKWETKGKFGIGVIDARS